MKMETGQLREYLVVLFWLFIEISCDEYFYYTYPIDTAKLLIYIHLEGKTHSLISKECRVTINPIVQC